MRQIHKRPLAFRLANQGGHPMRDKHGRRVRVCVPGTVAAFLSWPHALRLAAVMTLFLPLSIGPAIWLGPTLGISPEVLSKAYRPMLWLRHRAPDGVKLACDSYLESWSSDAARKLIVYHLVWDVCRTPDTLRFDCGFVDLE